MDGISNSPTRISNAISVSVSGIDSNEARKIASTPKGIVDFLVNLFTFGKVRRDLGKQYDNLLHDFSKEIISSMSDAHISDEFKGELECDFEGCKITFSSDDNFVTLKVASLDGKSCENAKFSAENFQRTISFFRMRDLAGAEFSTNIFNKNGKVNLQNLNFSEHDLSRLTLDEVDLSGSNFESSTLNDVKIFSSSLHDINVNNAKINKLELYRSNVRGVDFSVAKIGPDAVNMHSCLVGDAVLINKEQPKSVLMHSTLYYDNDPMLRPNYKKPPNEHSVILSEVNVSISSTSGYLQANAQALGAFPPPPPPPPPLPVYSSAHLPTYQNNAVASKMDIEPLNNEYNSIIANLADAKNNLKKPSDKPQSSQQDLQQELSQKLANRRKVIKNDDDDGSFTSVLTKVIPVLDSEHKRAERPLSTYSEVDWDS